MAGDCPSEAGHVRPSGTVAHHGGHDHDSSVRVPVEVRLRSIGFCRGGSEASGALGLGQGGQMDDCPLQWPNLALSARRRGKLQIGAWSCSFQGWVGSRVRWHNGEARDESN